MKSSARGIFCLLLSMALLSGCEHWNWWEGLNGANPPNDYVYGSGDAIRQRAQEIAGLEKACYLIAQGEDPNEVSPAAASSTSAEGASPSGQSPRDAGARKSVKMSASEIAAAARACRDTVVGGELELINEMWSLFQRDYFARSGTTMTTFESTIAGLGAFGAISPVGTAHTLAATAATLSTMGTSIQKNLFGGQVASALLAQMDADREQIGTKIRENLAKSYNDYPLSVAMYDVAAYAAALSVPSALASIAAASGAKRTDAVNAAYASIASSPDAPKNASAPHASRARRAARPVRAR
ncbi:hypothetical protein [Trinickia diaoshuihuensis]|jgi:hypothetical protein|uniref:hypothetical protein n=1 Tax=Trinickia diaoshuihuensis TaxID=2292265 RepID=UPI0013C356D4|nr:hypothetical protein [Trinickia diaoshuihuensis]